MIRRLLTGTQGEVAMPVTEKRPRKSRMGSFWGVGGDEEYSLRYTRWQDPFI